MLKSRISKFTLGIITLLLSVAVIFSGCTLNNSQTNTEEQASYVQSTDTVQSSSEKSSSTSNHGITSDGKIDTDNLFSERDLTQTADTSSATVYTVTDGTDITITQAGVYVLDGTASNMTVYVEAGDEDKVQLVLNGVSITNSDKPCIYVKNADKVFVTTAKNSSLTVNGSYAADSENADAAIFSCDDLTLNGTATLTVNSTDVGIDTKDDLKVTGGSYIITAKTKVFEANDSIRICDGTFTLNAGTDGLHSENTDDDSLGYIYISDGTFNINAGDDGIHGTSIVQLDGGSFTIKAVEGIEGTYVLINDGSLNITASDDGINAGQKSKSYDVLIEINGGEINITMGAGDTDGIDSNGNLTITGGTVNITGSSAFDYDGTGTYTGGTLTVNGQKVTELTQSMPGGGMGGNPGGGMRPNEGAGEKPNGNMSQMKPNENAGTKTRPQGT